MRFPWQRKEAPPVEPKPAKEAVETRQTFGAWHTRTHCKLCEWVYVPRFIPRYGLTPPPSICPHCGADTVGLVLRCIWRERKTWRGWRQYEEVSYEIHHRHSPAVKKVAS